LSEKPISKKDRFFPELLREAMEGMKEGGIPKGQS